jgi:RNA polymerase sigma factor (sigma-70 family)
VEAERSHRRLRLVGSEPAASDAALVGAVASGDVGALGELYDRHASSLLGFARHVAPAGEAEDVLQATFLRVLDLAGRFDPSADSARPWLFAIAVRIAQSRRRSLRRFASAVVRFAQVPRANPAQGGGASTDLGRALATLSHDKRIAFVLTQVEGFSAEEAAAMLDVPVGTVWTRLHHARRALRAFFGEQEADR